MGSLTMTKCSCGTVHLPPRARCINCSLLTESMEIENLGSILTYTILHATPEGFNSPLILGLIELNYEKSINFEDNTYKPVKPKIVCVGRISENDLKIGLEVSIEYIDDKYYFSKK